MGDASRALVAECAKCDAVGEVCLRQGGVGGLDDSDGRGSHEMGRLGVYMKSSSRTFVPDTWVAYFFVLVIG